MSISNLSLRGTLFACTSTNATTFTFNVNAQIAPQTIVPATGIAPVGGAPYYKVIVSGDNTGANAIDVGGVLNPIAPYPGNAAGAPPVYPAGFSVDLTGTQLIFRSGAVDTSNYVFTLY